jgi:hypothetical protein
VTSAARRDAALDALERSVREEAVRAQARAQAALRATPPRGRGTAADFEALAPLASASPERAVVVQAWDGRPIAWAGTARLAPDTVPPGVGITLTPFYAVLHASAEAPDGRRAVALTLLHAERPADTLSAPLDQAIARRLGSGAITWAPPAAAPDNEPGWRTLEANGRPLVVVRALVPAATEARLRAGDDARRRGVPLLFAMSVVLAAALWRRPASLRRRLAALAVPLAVLWIAPLNALSNTNFLFDPALYFARIGGPFTASVGALGLSGALCLLGLFAVLRSGRRLASRPVAIGLVLAVGAAAPFIMRDLSRGIAPPARGVPLALWCAWQVAPLPPLGRAPHVGAAAGRAALGSGRGLPPLVAPALAGCARPRRAPPLGGAREWPPWYPVPGWRAVLALALTRAPARCSCPRRRRGRSERRCSCGAPRRGSACGLAERDVAGLVAPDPDMLDFLARFGRTLAEDAAARDGPFAPGGLLRRWAQSPLARPIYPVALASWSPPGPVPGAPSDAPQARVVARAANVRWRVDSTSCAASSPSRAAAACRWRAHRRRVRDRHRARRPATRGGRRR